ncbi:M20 family metallopeptidase [Vibrio natriegens]|uniref:M20 aminoacylase family protein n=1 Tax=Vibrio natriegens TaxID=691 RepID=UPI001EFC40EB|nr:M20 aminoacylase family protein [Vibrio natriegens]MCG9701535.1 M20 family metallopeptidase [Vibrio natriegens]
MTLPELSLLKNADFVASCEPFIQTRHAIHTHPELGAEVPNTAKLVAELLTEWGYETHTGIGGYGVVGVLKQGTSQRCIGIRADMDALPIQEETGLPYASKIDGHMHACGHDGHTAILLAAAHYIAKHVSFDGTINLIFQPDEEGLSGAKAMIDDGLFDRFPCDAVFALHNMPGNEVGQATVRSGASLASSDKVTIRLTGKGGHAAMPHLSNDVTIAIGHIILGLQSIVSRNINPADQSIISIGQIEAGKTANVIPNDALMKLSVRNFSEANQDLIEQRIREVVAGQCQAFGIQGEVEYLRQVPSVFNSSEETLRARKVVKAVLGEDNVAGDEAPVVPGSEDFAWMLKERPGCYFFLANGVGDWHGCSVHNPGYDFNDQLVTIGAACWVELVSEYLSTE